MTYDKHTWVEKEFIDIEKLNNIENGIFDISKTHINKYNTVAAMLKDLNLSANDICQTLGYYGINDGGGAYYIISDDEEANQIDIHTLNNGKYAKIIKESKIDIRQYGCKPNAVNFDNTNRLNYLFSTNPVCTIIPSGKFYFNSTIFTKGNIECASDGILVANDNMLYGVVLCNYKDVAEVYNNVNNYIRIKVDANNKAKIGVALKRAKQAKIDLEIENSAWVAFRDRYAEKEYIRLKPSDEMAIPNTGIFNANENDINLLINGLSSNDATSFIGAWINSSDNIYQNIITKDVRVGIFTAGEMICAKSVHCWLSASKKQKWGETMCIYAWDAGAQLAISELYQDTMRFGVVGSCGGNVQYYLQYLNPSVINEAQDINSANGLFYRKYSYVAIRNRNSINLSINTLTTTLENHIPQVAPSANAIMETISETFEVVSGEDTVIEIPTDILPYIRYKINAECNNISKITFKYEDKLGDIYEYGDLNLTNANFISPADKFINKLIFEIEGNDITSDGEITFQIEKYVESKTGKTTINVKSICPKSSSVKLFNVNNAPVGNTYTLDSNAQNTPISLNGNEQFICQYNSTSRSQTLLSNEGIYYRLGYFDESDIYNENWLYGDWNVIRFDYATPEMFGAKGDGVTDDTNALQAALNSGKNIIANKIYKITSSLSMMSTYDNPLMFKFNKIIAENVSGYALQLNGSNGKVYGAILESTQGSCVSLGSNSYDGNFNAYHWDIYFGILKAANTCMKLGGEKAVSECIIKGNRFEFGGAQAVFFDTSKTFVGQNIFEGMSFKYTGNSDIATDGYAFFANGQASNNRKPMTGLTCINVSFEFCRGGFNFVNSAVSAPMGPIHCFGLRTSELTEQNGYKILRLTGRGITVGDIFCDIMNLESVEINNHTPDISLAQCLTFHGRIKGYGRNWRQARVVGQYLVPEWNKEFADNVANPTYNNNNLPYSDNMISGNASWNITFPYDGEVSFIASQNNTTLTINNETPISMNQGEKCTVKTVIIQNKSTWITTMKILVTKPDGTVIDI